MADPLLQVEGLEVSFATEEGVVQAVDGVSFDLAAGEVLAVVGESGSGKSVTAMTLMGLTRSPNARFEGTATYKGTELIAASEDDLRRVRGAEIAMIFQDPMTSLNPVLPIGRQIAEIIVIHNPGMPAAKVRERVIDLLALVGVPSPERRYKQYPHEFSGGMRQRAMIAMAIANEPALLIADEPTTALDVTIQAQVMEVLADVRERTGASMILITHDLGLVAERADRVSVMYGGRIAESADVNDLFRNHMHPYTAGLLASLPRLDSSADELYSIPGQPPGVRNRPSGCIFNPRCGLRQGREICLQQSPPLEAVGEGHAVACHFYPETRAWAAAIAAAHELNVTQEEIR